MAIVPHQISATQAAREIAAGRLTSEALVRACLSRVTEREAHVQAWAFLDPDLAIAQARACDRSARRGPLHGVPVGVKDVIDTADMPTRYNSPIYADHRPRADAACVAAVCCGSGARRPPPLRVPAPAAAGSVPPPAVHGACGWWWVCTGV